MATNIPPHNLGEVIDAAIALIDDPDVTHRRPDEAMPGPDFPTAGIINGAPGIVQAYRTGRGRVDMRGAHRHRRDRGKRERETHHRHRAAIPGEQGAPASRRSPSWCATSSIEGISELRDESDKDGMRVVIELRRGEVSRRGAEQSVQADPDANVFGINMVALREGQPRC